MRRQKLELLEEEDRMIISRRKLKNIMLSEIRKLMGDNGAKLPDGVYGPLDKTIKQSEFWKYENTEDDADMISTSDGWQNQTPAAQTLEDSIEYYLKSIGITVDVVIISAESDSNKQLSLPVGPEHHLYPNSLVVGGQQSVNKRGRFIMYLFMLPISEDFNPDDVDPDAIAQIVGNIVRHELIHAIQMEKRRRSQRISRLAAKDKFEEEGEIVDTEDRAAQLRSKIEIDAYAHEFAEQLLQKYGKEKSLDILRGVTPIDDYELSNQFKEYLQNVPGEQSTVRLKKKMYSHIMDLTNRGIYKEGKGKRKKRVKRSKPYEIGTKKNLYLDRPTSHGGWPEGPSKSYTSNKPVNVQISDWLKGMSMIEYSDEIKERIISRILSEID